MSLSVKFNGIELTSYINVLQGFTAFTGGDWEPNILSSDMAKRGADFLYTSYKEKTIRMPFTIKNNLESNYDALEKALNVDELKILTISSLPGKMFYAVPMDGLDFEELATLGEGTITWLVPDGLAHSTVETPFQAAANSDGILEATIVNTGTEAVPISYEITHNHENGYLGIVSEHGVMQFGDIDEVDKETRQKSQRLINYKKYSDFSAMTDGAGILDGGHTDYPMNGTFGQYTINGKKVLGLTGVGSGSTWHGAAKQITFPKDSNNVVGAANFFVQSKIWLETGKVEQTGVLEMVLGDEDGKHLASIHIVKQSTTANQASCIVQIQEKELGRHKYEPRADSVTTGDKGIMYIKKSGEVFEFYGAGKKYTFRYPSLKNKKAKTLTLFLGQYGTRGISNLIARMYVMELSVQKNNVTYRVDIPNRYPEGSKVFIDGETRRFYVDGIQENDEVRGTKWFEAPPGTTKVQFYHSDFSSPVPTITAKIREAYL